MLLSQNQFLMDYLLRAAADTVHSAHPFHLVGGFQALGDIFVFRYVAYKLREHFIGLPVDILYVGVQLARKPQTAEKRFIVFSDIGVVPPTERSKGGLLGRSNIRQEIIALFAVSAAHAFNLIKSESVIMSFPRMQLRIRTENGKLVIFFVDKVIGI